MFSFSNPFPLQPAAIASGLGKVASSEFCGLRVSENSTCLETTAMELVFSLDFQASYNFAVKILPGELGFHHCVQVAIVCVFSAFSGGSYSRAAIET